MSALVARLREACTREREQALFYRALAAAAEDARDAGTAERLNELLADEQHHVARLTARMLELGEAPPSDPPPAPTARLATWREDAEAREAAEVAWYESVLPALDDAATEGILAQILESERNHLKALGGKWMSAEAPKPEPEEP